MYFSQLIEFFSTCVVRSAAKGKCFEQDKERVQALVGFMSEHYQHIFKVQSIVG